MCCILELVEQNIVGCVRIFFFFYVLFHTVEHRKIVKVANAKFLNICGITYEVTFKLSLKYLLIIVNNISFSIVFKSSL